MVYDTFMYCGEDEILNIRLHELDNIVDKFIILESPKSHTRIPKEPLLQSQSSRFSKFFHKIDYYIIDYCLYDNPFHNDWNGRQKIHQILSDICNKNDIILHGDLDEIPNNSKLEVLIKDFNEICTLRMEDRILCFDTKNNNHHPGTLILKIDNLSNTPLYCLRDNRMKFKNYFNHGWHFTYCLSNEELRNKVKFFAHANETGTWAKTDKEINLCKKFNLGLDRNPLIKVDWTQENFPKIIFDNKEIYKNNLSFYQ